MFFIGLFQTAVSADDPLKAPDTNSALASYDAALSALSQFVKTSPFADTSELLQQVNTLRQEVQVLPRPELGTMAALQQANVPW
jgi:hypothetical protein